MPPTRNRSISTCIRNRVRKARQLSPTDSRVPELIHIDELDPDYTKRPDRWISGGLKCLDAALALRDAEGVSDTVFLVIQLKSGHKKRGCFIRTIHQLQQQVHDLTPPEIGWAIPGRRIKPPSEQESQPASIAGLQLPGMDVRFSEWPVPDGKRIEWARALWLISRVAPKAKNQL